MHVSEVVPMVGQWWKILSYTCWLGLTAPLEYSTFPSTHQVPHLSCWFMLWHNSSYRLRETGGRQASSKESSGYERKVSTVFLHGRDECYRYREGWAMCSCWKDSEYRGKIFTGNSTLMSPSCGSRFLNSDTCLLLQVSVLYHLCPFSSKQSSILYYVFTSGSYTQWMLNRWMTVW